MSLQVLSNSGTLVFLNVNKITFSALHVLQIFVLLCYKESYIKESELLESIFKTRENKPLNKWMSMTVWVGTPPTQDLNTRSLGSGTISAELESVTLLE